MTDILSEIKNNLEGNNRRVVKAKNQINDLEDKEAKINQAEYKKKKKTKQNKNKMRIVKAASATTLRGPIFTSCWCQKEKRKSKKLGIYLKKTMKENFLKLLKEIDM